MVKIIICKDCGEEKQHQAKGFCKPCYIKSWKEENKDEVKLKGKIYRKNNKERLSGNSKVYYQINKEYIKARVKKYSKIPEVKERIKEYNKYYRGQNIEKINQNKERWKQQNKEKTSQYAKNYRAKNPEKVKENSKRHRDKPESKLKAKQYRLLHKEELRDLGKKYKTEHKAKIDKQNSGYRQKNRETIIQRRSVWRDNNRVKLRTGARERYKERIINDVDYKMGLYLRTRVRMALQDKIKLSSTRKLIGCSIEYLKDYLESQFDDEMSWTNWGIHGWHIDHIIPCDSFNLIKEEEQRKCFNYSNLQPLWAEHNWRKSTKVEQIA